MSNLLLPRRVHGARTIAAAIGAAISLFAFQANAANTITFGANNNSCGGAVMCSTDGTHGYTNNGTGQAFNLSTISQWFQIDVNGSSEIPGQPVEPDKGAGGFLVLNDTGSAVSSFSLTVTDDFTAGGPTVHKCFGAQAGNICDNFTAHGGSGSYKFNTELSGTDWDRCTQGTTSSQTCTGSPGGVAADFAPNSVTYSWTGQNGSTIPAGSYFVISFSGWNNDGAAYQAPPPRAPAAYIANAHDGTVSVIDTSTNTVTATIPGFNFPSGVAATPDGRKVYVVNEAGNSVSVVETSSNTIAATIPVTAPYRDAVAPDGSKLYVGLSGGTSDASNTVYVIDTSTNTITGTVPVGYSPYGMAVSPDGTKLYVVINDFDGSNGTGPNYLAVVDTATSTLGGSIPISTTYPVNVAVSPDGTKVYVGDDARNHNDISVIDTGSNTVSLIPVGYGPEDLVVSPDSSKLYVVNGGDNTVSVVDTASNAVMATIPVGAAPYGLDITPDGSRVFVESLQTNTVSVIDTSSDIVTATVPESVPYSLGRFISP
ncbi:MAG TPA: YncE family protein [Rhizomicrobium sp.]|jgi:YVTN family beta-propeller protein|nr:YncE family protein [Rhizomicrobium sp.]